MAKKYKNPYDLPYPPQDETGADKDAQTGEDMSTEASGQQNAADVSESAQDMVNGDREIPIKEEDFPAEESISFIQNNAPLHPKDTQDVSDESSEIEALRKEMADLKLRQAADMENYKKRLAREHLEQLQYSAEKVLSDLLPTLDNLELALQYGNKSEECKDLLQGVAMTHKLLLDAVQKHGLTQVGVLGEPFDPAIHEAVGFEPESEYPQGAVARVLQHGYKLGKRLLRAARVMVAQ